MVRVNPRWARNSERKLAEASRAQTNAQNESMAAAPAEPPALVVAGLDGGEECPGQKRSAPRAELEEAVKRGCFSDESAVVAEPLAADAAPAVGDEELSVAESAEKGSSSAEEGSSSVDEAQRADVPSDTDEASDYDDDDFTICEEQESDDDITVCEESQSDDAASVEL